MASSHPSHSLENELKAQHSEFPLLEIGNEGLTKRVIRKGVTWQTPLSGDEVEVHFRGQVENGASLESSYDKGSSFRFKLGQCEVIKGWDEGVGSMKKGERAMFKMPPNLAYGELGSPPLVPPNATLIFDIELLSWNSIRDLTGGDGGIMKKLIQEGEQWATPRDADEVLVKYEARLESGKLVSKSDQGVEFNVSEGYLCPAMSIAVKTMRKGEVAELAMKFSYGLTQNSNRTVELDGCLLPGSNIATIKLELVSWKIVTDITGDKKILKKIKKAGEGFDRPNEGSLVKVIYLCKLEDGTVIEKKGSEEEPFEFTIQEEQVHEGLERAIMTMRKGEQAIVTISAEYSCDPNLEGNKANNKALYYEVELVDFVKEKPFWKMDNQEKLEACERKKHDGNLLFKAANFRRASKTYETAVKYIEFDHSFSDDEKRHANTLRLSCNLNNAACKLKLGEYSEASRLCTKVLEQDPSNVKALYRRCQAYLKTSDLEKAEADIKTALIIDPNNRDIKLEYKELKLKQKEYGRYEADIFSTMLSRMS